MNPIYTTTLTDWVPSIPAEQSAALLAALESGHVLYCPQLAFQFSPAEQRFLDPAWSNGKDKNISLEHDGAPLKGMLGTTDEVATLRGAVLRFRTQAIGLIETLFPAYKRNLRKARTSYRPVPVEGRSTSWRKDDSRLHVDAFPSRPNHGERILRVFANVNPHGVPRVWRIGEPFEALAQRVLPRIPTPLPGSSWLLHALHITKQRRSEYDHIMLNLHDRMKADLEYQAQAPQVTMSLAAGSVWICFSDQVSHAAMSGQFMLEQTLHVPVDALAVPEKSPLRTLERLTARALVV
ncbi:MAG: 3-deoxy-D-manno-oct-2-ulosonic acid (Kdo) hydroxylase [Burkholderiaceae bacterium]|nr:MAG: 3-deoxy-D-manno-oct-2-ulosonic acid (Kdo) hydroxylase [Burkholderiaceae bacterium]